jgi:hypothetical protein
MPEDRARNRNRVVDLGRTREFKKLTGKLRPIEHRQPEKARTTAKLIAGPGWMDEKDGK